MLCSKAGMPPLVRGIPACSRLQESEMGERGGLFPRLLEQWQMLQEATD